MVTFTGIPYADQPVGALRFRRTTSRAHFPTDAGAAGTLGHACPQSRKTSGPDGEPYPQNEACLYFQLAVPLSFFTTRPIVERALVTIHGGAFVLESSGAPVIDFRRPASLDGVASFSLNYRLGVLGFLTDDATHYNAGFYDQQRALEVISDVAVALGVQRTLLAGESAGASSVLSHLLTNSTGYEAALLQSPPAGIRLTTHQETQGRWTDLLRATGCFSVSCVQESAVDTLLTYQATLLLQEGQTLLNSQADLHGLMPLGLVQDGVVFTDNGVRQYLAGAGRHDLPIMVGTMQDEVLFAIQDLFPTPLPAWMYPIFSTLLVGPDYASQLRTQYPLLPADGGDVRGPLERAVTSWGFGCTTNDLAQISPTNAYYYFYTHPSHCSQWGSFCDGNSCHGDDLAVLYNASTPRCPEITIEESILGAQWRQRVWKMLDGEAPWSQDIADGVEIGRADWGPVTFDRVQNACNFWESVRKGPETQRKKSNMYFGSVK